MKVARGLVTLLALLAAASPVAAQGILVGPDPGFGGGLSISRGHGNRQLSLYLSAGFNRGYAASYPYYPPSRSVTVVTVINPPPLVVLPPPDPADLFFQVFPEARLPPALPPVMDRPLPGEVAGGFRPLDRDNRARARPPAPPPEQPKAKPPDKPRAPAPPPPKPKPEEPKPKPEEPRRAPELPPPPPPELNPRDEHNRQAALGRQAFAAGEYGRAAQRFRLAVAALPDEAMGHFLLGQALVALGKYDEAVAAVRLGLHLRPDWPFTRFRPLELYGDNVADYAEHLRRLEDVFARQPDDPVLLFLYAYQLWFDGRQEEAVLLFRRSPDRAAAERFLDARPPEIVPIL